MSIADKLESISIIKRQIKQVLNNSGVVVNSTVPFNTYPNSIESIVPKVPVLPVIESFNITGDVNKKITVNGKAEVGVSVVLEKPNGLSIPLIVNSDGSFSGTVIPNNTEGDYTLVAINTGGNFSTETKNVLFPISPIQEIFDAGAKGIWFNPNDLSTLFQDPEGLIPVTAIGQTVGCIKSLSGSFYWCQYTVSKQPVLGKNAVTGGNYLFFDGIDDAYNAFNPVAVNTSKLSTFFAGVIHAGTPQPSVIYGGVPSLSLDNNNGLITYKIMYENLVEATSFAPNAAGYVFSTDLPSALVMSAALNTQAADKVRANGFLKTGPVKSKSNYTSLSITQPSTSGATARFSLYEFAVFDREASASEITIIENYLATKSGVTLNV